MDLPEDSHDPIVYPAALIMNDEAASGCFKIL